MTRYELNRAVARATGDAHDVIMSRGFSLVDETAAIDDSDLEDLIADWDRIRGEEVQARIGLSIPSSSQSFRIRMRKTRHLRTRVLG